MLLKDFAAAAHKLADSGVELFGAGRFDLPLVAGCPAWRSSHHTGGGHFQATGVALPVQEGAP
ncbi:MAG: hypothetical protein RSC66_06575 [Comamonas sp.]